MKSVAPSMIFLGRAKERIPNLLTRNPTFWRQKQTRECCKTNFFFCEILLLGRNKLQIYVAGNECAICKSIYNNNNNNNNNSGLLVDFQIHSLGCTWQHHSLPLHILCIFYDYNSLCYLYVV
jgi:hypothetical protein